MKAFRDAILDDTLNSPQASEQDKTIIFFNLLWLHFSIFGHTFSISLLHFVQNEISGIPWWYSVRRGAEQQGLIPLACSYLSVATC